MLRLSPHWQTWGPFFPADGYFGSLLNSLRRTRSSTYGDLILGCLMDSKDILNIHHFSFYEYLGNSSKGEGVNSGSAI